MPCGGGSARDATAGRGQRLLDHQLLARLERRVSNDGPMNDGPMNSSSIVRSQTSREPFRAFRPIWPVL